MRVAGILAALSFVASGCLLILPLERATDSAPSTTTTSTATTTSTGSAGAGGSTSTGSGGTGGSGPIGGCVPECGQEPLPSVCRAGQCVQVTSPECLVVRGNWRDPNALLIGGYTLLPPSDPEGSTPVWNYELAIDELNAAGGLPDATGTKHPLVIVICTNDAPTPGTDTLPKSMNHLVDDLDVPAIVADLTAPNLARAFQMTVAKGKKVFFMSPGPATKEILGLPDNGIVWNMTGSARDLAPSYQSLVQRIETRIKRDAPSPIRVAVVKTSDAADPVAAPLGELFEALGPMLQFNGKNKADNELDNNYREFIVDAAHGPTVVAVEMVKYEPHVVISMIGSLFTDPGTNGQPTGVAAAMEQTLGPMRFRPYYVLNPINFVRLDSVQEILKGFFQFFPTIHQRFVGINIAGAEDQSLYRDYWMRLHSTFDRALPDRENCYDPIYYLAYSMYIAGVEQHLDGTKVQSGMLRLLSGKVFDVGPIPIPDVLEQLRDRQTSIHLRGTMGLPFFESGARRGRGALYCFANATEPARTQVQVYDPDTQTWSGTFSCYTNGL